MNVRYTAWQDSEYWSGFECKIPNMSGLHKTLNKTLKFQNWNMKNEFSIFNFLIKIRNWKLKIFYNFSIFNFELKIEICKIFFSHLNFKLKIEWHFRCTDWIGARIIFHSNFQFKIEMEKNPCTESAIQFSF